MEPVIELNNYVYLLGYTYCRQRLIAIISVFAVLGCFHLRTSIEFRL